MTTRVSIVALVDRTGSMRKIREEVEGSFNAFIDEQRKLTKELGDHVTVTLWQFDNTHDDFPAIEMMYANVPLDDVAPLVISPRGMTPLYDALGVTISKTGERYAQLPESERPDKVIFVVLTDGQENSSTEYNSTQVREMIDHQRDVYSWEFHFIGIGINAWDTSRDLGFKRMQTYSVTGQSAGQSYSVASASISRTRRGATPPQDTEK